MRDERTYRSLADDTRRFWTHATYYRQFNQEDGVAKAGMDALYIQSHHPKLRRKALQFLTAIETYNSSEQG